MKQNMWLLIVLIIVFVSLVITFFKALDFESMATIDIGQDISKTITEFITTPTVESTEPVSKPLTTEELLEGLQKNKDKTELFKAASGYNDAKQFKQAIAPIKQLEIVTLSGIVYRCEINIIITTAQTSRALSTLMLKAM